jgi:quercetin dioxygenase-like cupin family protein
MAEQVTLRSWSGMPERLVDAMTGPALAFDLASELTALRAETEWHAFGVNSKTLVKQPDLRVVLTALRRGARIAEHTTAARLCVQVLAGHLRMRADGRTFNLRHGHLLALDWGQPREIEALDDSAFLLTLTWKEGASA